MSRPKPPSRSNQPPGYLDAEGVQKLETLVRLSQRMEGLIESLLQLSRVGRTELLVADVDLNAVLAEVAELLGPRLEQTHTVLTVAGPLPTVRADGVRLQEVFHNLIANGMKYNDKPAKTVTVGLVPPEAAAGAARPVSADDFHVFYVRDNGIGIDARHQASIFKLFKRLHAQDKYGGGTGAGLAIAKKMVEKHGGSLWVESTRSAMPPSKCSPANPMPSAPSGS